MLVQVLRLVSGKLELQKGYQMTNHNNDTNHDSHVMNGHNSHSEKSYMDQFQERIEEFDLDESRETLKERAQSTIENSKAAMERAGNTVLDSIKDRPLVAVACAFGVGALVGLAFVQSSRKRS